MTTSIRKIREVFDALEYKGCVLAAFGFYGVLALVWLFVIVTAIRVALRYVWGVE